LARRIRTRRPLIDGEFVPGGTGWVKPKGAPPGPFPITDVAPMRSWAEGVPFGKLRGTRTYESLGDGKVCLAEDVEIHGPFGPLFRLIGEKGMRADMPKTSRPSSVRRCAGSRR
jgi:hypothetical protein